MLRQVYQPAGAVFIAAHNVLSQRQVQERFREYIKSKEPSDPMHQLTARDRMTRRYHPS